MSRLEDGLREALARRNLTLVSVRRQTKARVLVVWSTAPGIYWSTTSEAVPSDGMGPDALDDALCERTLAIIDEKRVDMEVIVAAAIRYGADVWTLPKPARHHHIIAAHGSVWVGAGRGGDEQGFLTNKGRFVSRQEAARIAYEAGQVTRRKPGLSSEDLW